MARILDILLSGLALLLLSPLLLLIVVTLRLTGEGEVLFVQQRIGRGGQLGTGTVTVKDDPRVLPVGRVLRKTKLNELPQLLNIFFGDMSIVGPRPQTQRCFDAFPAQSQIEILKVRPGLSGVGSIIFRGEENMMSASGSPEQFYDQVIMPYKGKLEEWYVAHQGLRTYIECIGTTVWVVLFSSSPIAWTVFRGLPAPPPELAEAVNWPGADRSA